VASPAIGSERARATRSGLRTLVLLNVAGGVAVLGSYAACLAAHPAPGDFWGGVPEGLRGVYTLNMFLAAAGYLAFTFFVAFRLPPSDARGRPGLGTFNALYALILVPSALWMPLTFAMLEAPSAELWWIIRLVLAAVGVGSVGMLAALIAARPGAPRLAHALAVAGAVPFCVQTALLDAVIWTAYFPA